MEGCGWLLGQETVPRDDGAVGRKPSAARFLVQG